MLSQKLNHFIRWCSVLALLVGVLANVLPAQAATSLTVTTLEDKVNPNDGKCSLREAMGRAFDNSNNNTIPNDCPQAPGGNTTIKFGVSGTIVISSGVDGGQLPNIINSVTLIGPITLDLAKANQIVLDVESNGRLNLVNMTIKNAFYTALDSRGEINIANVKFENNGAGGAGGGAIRNDGVAVIAGSTFLNNRAVGAGMEGGAIRSTWKLSIAGSTFTGNTADKNGGAIAVKGGWMEMVDSTFTGNVVKGTLLPSAKGEGGGALYVTDSSNTYPMTVTRGIFNGNYATQGVGGAIFQNSGSSLLTIVDSSFQGNGVGSQGYLGSGGAIRNVGVLTIKRTMFLANSAIGDGGAISNDYSGNLTLRVVGFTGNNASQKGGAIANLNGSSSAALISVIGAQLTGNIASDKGGGIYNHDSKYDVAEFRLSVWAGNLPQDCRDQNSLDDNLPLGQAVTPIESKGQNSFGDTSCDDDDEDDPPDQVNADPMLDDPAPNGGVVPGLLTQKPLPGSPLVDVITPTAYSTDPDVSEGDVRGLPRLQNGDGIGLPFFDIGPFELDDAEPEFSALPAAPGPINFGNVQVNQTYTKTDAIRVFNGGAGPLTLSNFALSGANLGDFAVTSTPGAIAYNFSGYIGLRCKPTDKDARTATLSFTTNDPDHASVSFNLICQGSTPAVAGFDSAPDTPGLVSNNTTEGTAVPLYVVVYETGNTTLTLTNPSLVSNPPGAITLQSTFPLTVSNGGGPIIITLACAANAIGLHTATFTFATNDTAHPNPAYNLTCTVDKAPDKFIASSSSQTTGLGGVDGAYGIAISPDGQQVYVADVGDSALVAYSVTVNNTLSHIATYSSSALSASSQYTSPYQVAVSTDGGTVYVTGYSADSVTAYTRDAATGALTFLDTVKDGQGYGCGFTIPITCAGYVSGLDGAYGLAFSPDGGYAYVSSIISNSVVVFQRSKTNGALSTTGLVLGGGAYFVQRYTHPLLDSAYGLATSPDGLNVYVTGYTSDSLLTLKRNPSTGMLSTAQVLTPSAAAGLNGVFRVNISPDGNFVYTAAFDSDSICTFARNQIDGTLTPKSCYANSVYLDAATDTLLTPDGKHLIATTYYSKGVVVFKRDTQTGALTYQEIYTRSATTGLPALDGARGVVVNPNSRAVYATGYVDDSVVTLLVGNPRPVLSTLSPVAKVEGSATFSVTVNGTDFTPDSVVRVNGANRTTYFMNETQLLAEILADDLLAAGTRTLTVNTPTPGGGDSNPLVFTVLAPGALGIPSINQISVPGALAGGNSVTVEVWGNDFAPGATLLWNGSPRSTTYLSAQQLTAVLTAADLAQPGTGAISVQNTNAADTLAPLAVTGSTPVGLKIVNPNQNPAPGLTLLYPAALRSLTLDPQVPVTLTGTNFMLGSRVLWNGEERPTVFVNATTLKLFINAGDLALPGVASVQVANPIPGGGDSNVLTFTILEPDIPIFWPYRVYMPSVMR